MSPFRANAYSPRHRKHIASLSYKANVDLFAGNVTGGVGWQRGTLPDSISTNYNLDLGYQRDR